MLSHARTRHCGAALAPFDVLRTYLAERAASATTSSRRCGARSCRGRCAPAPSCSAPETWWLADAVSLRERTPSPYFIEAIEDSELLLLDGPSHQRLVDGVPGY